MIRILHDSRNGIDHADYKIKIVMNNTFTVLKDCNKYVQVQEFKYKNLEEKLKELFNQRCKILVSVPYGQLKLRINKLNKLGYKIERMSRIYQDISVTDRIDLIVTK